MTSSSGRGMDGLRLEHLKKRMPELKDIARRTYKQVLTISRNLSDTMGSLDTFSQAAKCIGEIRTLTFSDKKGNSYPIEVIASKSGWRTVGHNIRVYLSFLQLLGSEEGAIHTMQQSIEQGDADSINFHLSLIQRNPIIGCALLFLRHHLQLARSIEKTAKYDAEVNPAIWFSDTMRVAQQTHGHLGYAIDSLRSRCSDEISQQFLSDVQRECELLIAECCYFSGRIAIRQIEFLHKGNDSKQYFMRESPFPLTVAEYDSREQEILNLRNVFAEHFETLYSAFPMPNRKSIEKTGIIYLPVYLSSDDIAAFLQVFSSFLEAIADGIKPQKSFLFKSGNVGIINTLQIGIQSGSAHSQDRLSIRTPSFNIRVDRDDVRKTLGFDIGSASVDHALACAYDAMQATHDPSKGLSIFKDTTARRSGNSYPLENKMALVASIMMGATHLVGLRTKPTISHHSREFVAKDEYYNNFSNILADIKEGLERKSY